MTKREAETVIRGIIEKHGFIPEDNMRNALPGVERTGESAVSFNITERTDFTNCDTEHRTVKAWVEASASICRMGGSPSAEELLDAADQIRRGAELVAELQQMAITYTIEF